MTREHWLAHVTLTTGHVRKSYRDEVDDAAMQWARQSIRDALVYATTEDVGTVPLPPLGPDWRLACTRERSSTLLCSVWQDLALVVTFGVASSSRYAGKLWQWLIDTASPDVPIHESVTAPPGAPWVAVRLELGAVALYRARDDERLWALADLERCVGWGFLEMQ